MMMQKGVYMKNPNPKASPARNVDIEAMIAQIFETTNQEVQYAR